MPDATLVKSILTARNADFAERAEQWARDEELYRAGAEVRKRLTPFQWETAASGVTNPDTAGLVLRQERAEFAPFAQIRAEAFVGTVMQRAPRPGQGLSFGALGEVREDRGVYTYTVDGAPATEARAKTAEAEGKTVVRERVGTLRPTPAELLWENADGVGQDAQGLLSFFEAEMGLASATDYRYVFVEAPPGRPETAADEIAGHRPYFVDFGPQHVPYTVYVAGALAAAHLFLPEQVREVTNGTYTDEKKTRHMLVTREGFEEWGPDFVGGGWWVFDDDGVLVKDAAGADRTGTWANTKGQIPMTRIVYKRGATGEPVASGASWLNNLSLAHMDAGSWHWNDLRVSGGRKRYWLGADPDQWKTLAEQSANGAVEVPVPARADGGEVKVYDTGEVTVGSAMAAYQEGIERKVKQFFLREITQSPDASGTARMVGELQGKSPLLAHVAGNMEEAMWTALRFVEARWTGADPTASATFPRDFDLRNVVEKLDGLVGVFKGAGLAIPPSAAPLFGAAVESTGLVSEGGEVDMDALVAEVATALGKTAAQNAAALDADAFFASAGDGAAGTPTLAAD